jgi:hypothetical protein
VSWKQLYVKFLKAHEAKVNFQIVIESYWRKYRHGKCSRGRYPVG